MKQPPPRHSIRSIPIDNNNWELYKVNHPELDKYRIQEVEKMLDCCNPKKGFFKGICVNCEKEVILYVGLLFGEPVYVDRL